jgi:hypothetical protein
MLQARESAPEFPALNAQIFKSKVLGSPSGGPVTTCFSVVPVGCYENRTPCCSALSASWDQLEFSIGKVFAPKINFLKMLELYTQWWLCSS